MEKETYRNKPHLPHTVREVKTDLLDSLIFEKARSFLKHGLIGHKKSFEYLVHYLGSTSEGIEVFQEQKRFSFEPEYTVFRIEGNPSKVIKARFGSSHESHLLQEAE